ncbi:MAG: DUF885 domain-containing protein [Planctomycetota bacterium]|nr:DUF885 domain-containing protein [Planctomycetota bacterium]
MGRTALPCLLVVGCVLAFPGPSGGGSPLARPDEPEGGGSGDEEHTATSSLLDAVDASESELRPIIERYAVDRAVLARVYDVPMSPARRDRLREFHEEWLRALETLPFDDLSQDGRVDYILLRSRLRHELRSLAYREKRDDAVRSLVPFSTLIVSLEEARRRKEEVDPRKAAQSLSELSRQVKKLREELKDGAKREDGSSAVKKTVANRAFRRIRDLRGALGRWFHFYSGYDPDFTWWVKRPHREIDRELEAYAALVREKLVGVREGDDDAIVGDPIGRAALLDELSFEMIPYTPEELVDIARRELAWCQAEMLRASRELGFGEDWRQALDHVKSRHVEPGKQPSLVRDLANEAVRFLDERQLITVPALCRETWRMEMMSPERQKVNPYFTGGEVITVSYPTDDMSHDDKLMSMRGNNVHFSRATVHHELIPGHHLQGFMTARHRSYRRIFRTPFWVEGWALYWELLLWDLKFPRSAEDRVGMLFWRSHRCARIIFSLKYHLEQMTADEAIDFLVENVGHERNNAAAEVRRSVSDSYGPLYQCAYMLGGLQIRSLRKELVGSGKMTDREFHDAVIRQNSIPIEMIRAALTDQRLRRDFSSGWRFYD